MIFKFKSLTLLFVLSICPLWASGDGWMNDFEAAKAKAKKEGKDLLIDFTGSDWCGWCIKLNKEVFEQEVFKKEAPLRFILVELDFPRKKELSETLKKQNASLRDRYSVEGFPTVMICDADGRPYAKTGYRSGKPEDYLQHLTDLQGQKKHRDDAFAESVELEGVDKARAIEKALSVVPPKCLSLYQDELASIVKSDPDDISGFTAKIKVAEASKQLRSLINPLFKERDFASVPIKVDRYIEQEKPTGEALQTALLYKLQAFYMEKKYDDALKLAEKIISINDTNQPARFSGMIKKRIELLKK